MVIGPEGLDTGFHFSKSEPPPCKEETKISSANS